MSTTNFDKSTLTVLENFARLNPACCLEKGNVIRTANPAKTVLCTVKIKETIPEKFNIVNLPSFLTMLKLPLFAECEIEITEQKTTISNAKARQTFLAGADGLIKLPKPEQTPGMGDLKFEGSLTHETQQHIATVTRAMKHDLVEFTAVGGKLKLRTVGSSDAESSNPHEIEIGSTTASDYKIAVKAEYLNVIPTDYKFQVGLNDKNQNECLVLTSQDAEETVQYFIGAELAAN